MFLNLAADSLVAVGGGTVDTATRAVATLVSKIMSLFSPIPETYQFFVYFVVAFIICVSFKFLIDFLKIIFSMIFSKGGF